MATIYIDPDAVGPGSGTLLSPFKVFPTVVASGNSYLLREGSTYVGSVYVNSGRSNFLIGAYEALTGNVVSDNRKAKIESPNATAVHVGADCYDWVIQNLEISIPSPVNNPRGIVAGLTSTDRSYRGLIRRVWVKGVAHTGVGNGYGFRLQCDDTVVEDCLIEGIPHDGIFQNGGSGLTLRRLTIRDIDLTNTNGDCIQLDNHSNFLVEDCFLDHSNSDEKQCLIVRNGINGTIVGNVMIMPDYAGGATHPSKTLYVGTDDTLVARNHVYGGEWGVWIDGAGVIFHSNYVSNKSPLGLGGVRTAASKTQVYNNTIIGAGVGHGIDNWNPADIKVSIVNNKVSTFSTGIHKHTGTLEDYNSLWMNATNVSGTAGVNDLFVDPVVDASGRPLIGSPLLTFGANTGTVVDIEGVPGASYIGAYSTPI